MWGGKDRITRCPADKYRNIHCALGVNVRRVDDDDDDVVVVVVVGVCVCVCVGCSIAPVLEIIAYVDYVPAAARSPELLRRRAVPRQNLYRWHALLR